MTAATPRVGTRALPLPIVLGGAAASGVVGLAAAASPPVTLVVLGSVAAVGLVTFVAVLPWWAPPIYLAALPFVAGIDRGALLPLVRPNEALLALLVTGCALGGLARLVRGDAVRPRSHRLDAPLLALALLSTAWPVLSLLLRGHVPGAEDLAGVLPMVKLVGLFLLTRLALRGPDDVGRCLRLIVWTAVGVAVIAILQTLQVPPVVGALETWWPVSDATDDVLARGTTTLASPIATGDYVLFGLVVLTCLAARGGLPRRSALPAALVLGAGVLATGQFSTWIAAAVVAGLLCWRFPRLRRLSLRSAPLLVLAAVVGAPAVIGRLGGFGGGDGTGLPVSWLGRWDNLTHFYLPAFDPLAVVLGVSPDSVLAAPETWRDVIYLEAGYLDLLWIGGLPLLVAFGWLSVVLLRVVGRDRSRPGTEGVVAQALEILWWYLLVLTVVDPHLTMRGTGDLLAVLLAALTLLGGTARPLPARREAVDGARGQRALDLAIAVPALVVLSPLLVGLALLVRVSGPGPVLFRQERVGLGRRPFTLLKFRTMAVGVPSDGGADLRDLIARELRGEDTAQAGSCKLDDPRVTPVGRVLRRTSLDEVPQLWNVVRGEMSLVGPRPCLPWEAAMFPAEYDRRFTVRPGLTGLWQVNGRSTRGTLEMLEFDRRYVDGRSVLGDVALLVRTVPALLRGDGAR